MNTDQKVNDLKNRIADLKKKSATATATPEIDEVKDSPMNKKVLDTLADWIIRTVDKNYLATPEEVGALPKVAEVFLKNYSSCSFSPVKKE